MKRKYETTVIYDGSLPEDAIAKEQTALEAFLQANAEFEKTEILGKRQLAYEIARKKSGYYFMFIYSAEGDLIAKLDKMFKLNANVIRQLTVVADDAPYQLSAEDLDQAADEEEEEE